MSNVLRLVLHGSGVGEEFAIQMTYQLDGAITVDELKAITDGFATEFTGTAKTDLLAMLPADQAYDLVSGYFYATTPNDPATLVSHTALTGWTGTTSNTLPLQTAMCVTTHSNYAGASNRGRMYLPATGLNMDVHKFITTNVDQAVVAVKGLLEQGSLTIKLHSPVTAAQAIVFSPKKGTGQAITSVSADNKPDTQRRRAMSESPTYNKTQTVSTS